MILVALFSGSDKHPLLAILPKPDQLGSVFGPNVPYESLFLPRVSSREACNANSQRYDRERCPQSRATHIELLSGAATVTEVLKLVSSTVDGL